MALQYSRAPRSNPSAAARRTPLPGYRPQSTRTTVTPQDDAELQRPAYNPPSGNDTPDLQLPQGVLDAAAKMGQSLPTYEPQTTVTPTTDPASGEAVRPRGTPKSNSEISQPITPQERVEMLLTEEVRDMNGRGSSALKMLQQPIQPTDSLGNAAGQKVGQLLTGLFNPRADEEIEHNQTLQKAVGVAQTQGALDKMGRDAREQEAEITYKQSLPGYKTEQQRQAEQKLKQQEEDQRRRALASVYNKLEDFDPNDPANADFVNEARALNLPVIAKKKGERAVYKQDMRTGSWYVFRGNESDEVKAPGSDQQLKTTTASAMSAEQQEKNRQSKERIAKWQISAANERAAQSRAIQQDRLKLSKTQFEARYPGYGFELTTEDIIRRANERKMLPEDVAKEAVRQGYTIKD